MKQYRAVVESNLRLPANSYVYNISPTSAQHDPRSHSYSHIRSTDNILAISSDDSVRILDTENLKVVNTITKAHSSITSIKRYANSGEQCTTFVTCGRDGRVRGWDVRSNSKALEFSASKGEALSALDCSADLHAVVAGTELEGNAPGDVSIFGWDVRMPGSEAKMKYEESHNDTVTELRFLPAVGSTNTLLLSAGTDGMVNIFDTATVEEDDALYQVIRSTSALQHAGLIDGDIFSLGTDETLSFHAFQNQDLETQDPAPCSLGDVRELFGCEYVVNMYQTGTKPYLAVGNHTDQWLDLVRFKNKASSTAEARKWKPKSTEESRIRLVGGHGEELVRDIIIPDGADIVYTCGEDGMVRMWKAEGDEDGDIDMSGMVKAGKKRKSEQSERKEKRSKPVPSN